MKRTMIAYAWYIVMRIVSWNSDDDSEIKVNTEAE